MNLTICVACGHPANEHGGHGCRDFIDMGEDGYPLLCACARSQVDVYTQHVPPVDESAPATEARGGEEDS